MASVIYLKITKWSFSMNDFFWLLKWKLKKKISHTYNLELCIWVRGFVFFLSKYSLIQLFLLKEEIYFCLYQVSGKTPAPLLLSVNLGLVSYLTNEPLSSSPVDCTAAISWSFQSSICLSPPELSLVIRIHFLISRGNQLQMSVL